MSSLVILEGEGRVIPCNIRKRRACTPPLVMNTTRRAHCGPSGSVVPYGGRKTSLEAEIPPSTNMFHWVCDAHGRDTGLGTPIMLTRSRARVCFWGSEHDYAPHIADSPRSRHNLSGFEPSGKWDWLHLNSGLESHAPVFLPNGSLLTFTRSFHDPHPAPTSSVWLVGAEAWNGTYRSLARSPSFDVSTEDSHMWIDPRGNFHALFHTWPVHSQNTASWSV